MLYGTSDYAFGDFSENPALSHLSSDPMKYRSAYFMPNQHDRMVTRFRDWIHKKARGGLRWGKASIINGLPQRLPPNELFSVYNEHTKSCTICQRAVKTFSAIRNVSAVFAALSMLWIKRRFLKILAGGVFSIAALMCHNFMKRYFVHEYSHQTNN